jgi:hypothetical protein
MTSNYAGCGCTALTPSYAGPMFAQSRPRGYGVEDDKGLSDRARYTGIGATLFVLAGMVYFFNEAEKEMRRSTPRKPIPTYNVPRAGASRK